MGATLLVALIVGCSVPDQPLLAAPVNVTAEPTEGGVMVSWVDVSLGEEGFRVYRLDAATPAEDPEQVGATGVDELTLHAPLLLPDAPNRRLRR